MSVMDSIEEKYQQEIAALKAENEQLRKNSEWQATEIETLRKRVILIPAEACGTYSHEALRGGEGKG